MSNRTMLRILLLIFVAFFEILRFDAEARTRIGLGGEISLER